MLANTTGERNTALGTNSLQQNISGNSNTAIGFQSLYKNTTASSNISIGDQAMYNNLTGANNIAIGNSSGNTIASGSNNIIIGDNVQASSSTASNETVIGNSSTVSANIKGTLKSNGQVLAIAAKSAAYTALVSDEIITGDATSAAFTITLPTAVGKNGQTYTIKRINSGANAVTVATTSSQTIDGAATYALSAQYNYVKVVSDGSHWIIVGK